MGMYCTVCAIDPSEAQRILADPRCGREFIARNRHTPFVSLEKAWHGLHYLLTGSAMEDELPLAFIIAGGQEVGEDLGYGPARLLSAEAVKELDSALSKISNEQLWSRFNPETMNAEGIYPSIWDEPEDDLRDEYLTYFSELKVFVHQASANGQALLVYLG